MNKPWVGYLSSVMLLFAGILMIIGNRPGIGAVFIVLAIAGLVIKFYMNRKSGGPTNQ